MQRDNRATGLSREPSTVWLAYLVTAWAFLLAAVSYYWAAGGSVAIRTLARDIDEIPLANNPAIAFGTGVLKALAGFLALALIQASGRSLPRRLLLVATWVVGGVLTLYGLANLGDHGLMIAGVRDTPEVLGARATRWHFLLWDPVWLLGGLLFLALARSAGTGHHLRS